MIKQSFIAKARQNQGYANVRASSRRNRIAHSIPNGDFNDRLIHFQISCFWLTTHTTSWSQDASTQFEESTGAPDTTMESAVYVYKGKTEQGDAPKDIQKATVASQVHIIFAESFQDCTLLVSVILPLGLRVIEEHAFANCTSLKTIPIPSSVCIIHYGAFMTCEGLETMDLPEGLTEVTDQTFEGCSSLRHAHIPSTVLYVGGQAFMGCGQLRDMDLPYGLHQIGSTAFGSCRSLERILIPSTVVAIGGRIFSECTALKSVEIGTDSGLQVIGPDAFKDCAQLMNVVIPSNCKVYSGVPEGFSIRRHASVDQPQLTNDATRAFHGAADTTPDSTMYIYQIEDDAVPQEIEGVIVEARIQIIRPEVFNACQLWCLWVFPWV
ncbi:unnamed protein product [Cylindrotheca closterium]|uniref:Leucine-rich repeat domain-containing protein n=1 Tax=Cylindrotheca closterium TaxID=2856 RepID=A0AAD2FKD4_9STRA|nr:unnamed protein product [Cylindrotheca closterium]